MLQVRAPFVIRPVSRTDVVVPALLQELQGGWYQRVSGGEVGALTLAQICLYPTTQKCARYVVAIKKCS